MFEQIWERNSHELGAFAFVYDRFSEEGGRVFVKSCPLSQEAFVLANRSCHHGRIAYSCSNEYGEATWICSGRHSLTYFVAPLS